MLFRLDLEQLIILKILRRAANIEGTELHSFSFEIPSRKLTELKYNMFTVFAGRSR